MTDQHVAERKYTVRNLRGMFLMGVVLGLVLGMELGALLVMTSETWK